MSGEQYSQKAGAEAALDSAAIDLAFLLTRTDEVYPYPLTEGTAKPIAFSTEQEAALEEIALILDEVRDGYTGGGESTASSQRARHGAGQDPDA